MDFDHLKAISAAIRNLLKIDKTQLCQYLNYKGHRSISKPLLEPYDMYLQVGETL